MSELRDPTRESLAETVRTLVKRHGGPTAVARLVNVDRTRVHAWMKGDIGIDRLGQLAYSLDEPITVHFGPDTEIEAAPPDWAERLVDDAVTKIVTLLGGPEYPDALERLRVRLADTPPLPHEVPPEGDGAQDPGTTGRPGHRVG